MTEIEEPYIEEPESTADCVAVPASQVTPDTNPRALGWWEDDPTDISGWYKVPTSDTSPVAGKTYYSRVTAEYVAQEYRAERSNTMPNLNPVWKEKFYIGTELSTGTTPAWTYSPLCAGIESVSPTVNEQNQQQFFLCGHGGANNEVTGIAPQYAISGKRIQGDAAQDYIVGLRYALGAARKSSMKVEIYDADDALVETIVADCTITDVVDFGGNTTDVEPFSCTLRINGIPTVTPAT